LLQGSGDADTADTSSPVELIFLRPLLLLLSRGPRVQMYKCIRCARPLEKSFGTAEIECECGSRVFVKERPSIEKVIIPR
jgi:DNA-directed RNA polymerase subunit P